MRFNDIYKMAPELSMLMNPFEYIIAFLKAEIFDIHCEL